VKIAKHWLKENGFTRCLLCPHECLIIEDNTGLCRARKNISGELFSLSYGKLACVNLDPIEKKPLKHFYPGTKIMSFGSFGCNFRCSFCQNWQISQSDESIIPLQELSSEEASKLALTQNSIGAAYTYNEPLINFEWVLETAQKVKSKNGKNVLVTNAYANPQPLDDLLGFIDAANIDVKAFTESFYRKYCGGSLRKVIGSVEKFAQKSVHIEITTLLIPGENDSVEEISKLVDWLAGINAEIPLHFSKYFPSYKLELEPTPIDILQRAADIASKKLKYVYLGNV